MSPDSTASSVVSNAETESAFARTAAQGLGQDPILLHGVFNEMQHQAEVTMREQEALMERLEEAACERELTSAQLRKVLFGAGDDLFALRPRQLRIVQDARHMSRAILAHDMAKIHAIMDVALAAPPSLVEAVALDVSDTESESEVEVVEAPAFVRQVEEVAAMNRRVGEDAFAAASRVAAAVEEVVRARAELVVDTSVGGGKRLRISDLEFASSAPRRGPGVDLEHGMIWSKREQKWVYPRGCEARPGSGEDCESLDCCEDSSRWCECECHEAKASAGKFASPPRAAGGAGAGAGAGRNGMFSPPPIKRAKKVRAFLNFLAWDECDCMDEEECQTEDCRCLCHYPEPAPKMASLEKLKKE